MPATLAADGAYSDVATAPTARLIRLSQGGHLHRLRAGTYSGRFAAELLMFESKAVAGCYQPWMSEISPVEMLQGRENPVLDPSKVASLETKDESSA